VLFSSRVRIGIRFSVWLASDYAHVYVLVSAVIVTLLFNTQYYHFSGISENLKMSGNLAKASEKSGERPSQGKLWEFAVREICGSSTKCW